MGVLWEKVIKNFPCCIMNKYKLLCLVSYSIELTRKKLVPESWEKKQKTIGNAHNLKEIRVKLRLGNFHTL